MKEHYIVEVKNLEVTDDGYSFDYELKGGGDYKLGYVEGSHENKKRDMKRMLKTGYAMELVFADYFGL